MSCTTSTGREHHPGGLRRRHRPQLENAGPGHCHGGLHQPNYAAQYELPGTYAPIASYSLVEKAVNAARARNLPVKVGNVLSSDIFYDESAPLLKWQKMGVLAVEMESAGLYIERRPAGKNALTLPTISDCPLHWEETTAEERQNTFTQMMEIALEIAE